MFSTSELNFNLVLPPIEAEREDLVQNAAAQEDISNKNLNVELSAEKIPSDHQDTESCRKIEISDHLGSKNTRFCKFM